MGFDWAYLAKRWVISDPTSYAMVSSGWYWEKKGKTLWDVVTNYGKGVQESRQNLAWFVTTGPRTASRVRWKVGVESWRWCPMSRSVARKWRRWYLSCILLIVKPPYDQIFFYILEVGTIIPLHSTMFKYRIIF